MTHEVTGYMKSRWSFTLAGTEYDVVRMAVNPVSSLAYWLNWVSNTEFACETGIRIFIHSPVAEVCAVTLFLASQVLTAWTLSGFGAKNASAFSPTQLMILATDSPIIRERVPGPW